MGRLSTSLTDIGFTGHRHNNIGAGTENIGLVYMNARWYVVGIGRFASADTLVPDPANPQSYNRYSYVENRPLLFRDPTGHISCTNSHLPGDDQQACQAPQSPPAPPAQSNPLPAIPTGPMVTFGGEGWSTAEQDTIIASAVVTGTALATTLNARHHWNLTAEQAFLLVYGGSVNFRKTGTACASGCWGETFFRAGRHEIEVYTNADLAAGDARWGVHELGHAFVNAVAGRARPVRALEQFQALVPSFPDRPVTPNDPFGTWGFAGRRYGWQRSDQGRPSEEFADMYLGWVYNQWEPSASGPGWSVDGQMRANYMNFFMPLWVDAAINR